MRAKNPRLAVNHAFACSAVSNGSRLVEGVDGRTAGGRRLRDLAKSFAQPFGGLAALSESDRALIRQAASLTLQCERLQGAIARGEAVDTDALIRLSSEARRALKGIGSREVSKLKTLAEHFAAKRGAAA